MAIRSLVMLMSVFAIITSSSATPILQFDSKADVNNFVYDFTFDNKSIDQVDEIYIEFSLADPDAGLVSIGSPQEWDYFDGQGFSIDNQNNYWVAWTADFGAEIDQGLQQKGFSIVTASKVSSFNYSWNWDIQNAGLAVPEPSVLPMLFGGMLLCFSLRKRYKSN